MDDTMAYFMPAIDYTLDIEQGFCDNPADPGGATNYGVSLATLHQMGDPSAFDCDHDGDVDNTDVKMMNRDAAVQFYRKAFWDPLPFHTISDRIVATKFFDMHVNMGPRQATRIMQRALSWVRNDIIIDGIFGNGTAAAINAVSPTQLIRALVAELAKFYFTLVEERNERKIFLLGWLRRAYKVPV